MSLAERKIQAQKEIDNKNKLPDGSYRVRLKDWKFGKSKAGKDMYTLTWKIKDAIKVDKMPEGLDVKGKERKQYFVTSVERHVRDLLDILEGTGIDLSEFKDITAIDDIFEIIEDTKMPTAVMSVTTKEGSQFPDLNISEVETIIGKKAKEEPEEEEGEDEQEEEEEKPVVAPRRRPNKNA